MDDFSSHRVPKFNAIEIQLTQPTRLAGSTRLEARVVLPDGQVWTPWFEFSHPSSTQLSLNPRPFLLATLPLAMRYGLPIRCEHGVDAVTRRQLTMWSETFAGWIPDRLRSVELAMPESACVRAPEARGTLQAFSGGVDSAHTLLTRRDPVRHAGLMVHGFDIPLIKAAGFADAWANSSAMLHERGAEAFWLRTNLRERTAVRNMPDWEKESHGIWLAAALACLEPWFDNVVIPSTYSQGMLATPWGSHPLTDPLLGSAAVRFHHHGTELDKLGKVAALAAHAGLVDRLRVCWQLNHVPANCGNCYKCACTQVCLWLSGNLESRSFPKRCSIDTLARIPIKSASNRQLITTLAAVARERGRHDLADALDAALVRATRPRLPRWLRWLGNSS